MKIETEIKIEVNDLQKIDRIYKKIGKPEWNIQRNYIYPFKEGFLRIRYEGGQSFLTAKGKGLDLEFNQRPEIECEIPSEFFMDFAKLKNFLGNPKYYEKSRASAKYNECMICLDNLEGRYFIEIEGNKEKIKANLKLLKIENYPIEKRNYMEIIQND